MDVYVVQTTNGASSDASELGLAQVEPAPVVAVDVQGKVGETKEPSSNNGFRQSDGSLCSPKSAEDATDHTVHTGMLPLVCKPRPGSTPKSLPSAL